MRHFLKETKKNILKFKRLNFSGPMRLDGSMRRAAALVVMVLVTVASVATVMAATHTAHIVYDGKITDVEMSSGETDKILLKAGIKISSGDLVRREDDPHSAGDVVITVRTAFKVGVTADGAEKEVFAHYGDTVADVIKSAGVAVDGDDEVTPTKESAVSAGTQVRVVRKYQVSVSVDGGTVKALAHEGSVSNVLKEAGVVLNADDIVSKDLNSPIDGDTAIKVSRVTYKEITETEPVTYKIVTKKSADLKAGIKKVETAGQNGSKAVVTRQKLVDGKLAESTVVSTAVTEQPVNKVITVGTRKKSAVASVGANGKLTDQNGRTVSYKKVLTGRCSCYCTGTTTSTGKRAAFGRVAVNPNIIPYGTRLYICSPNGKIVYGYATAEDTGGAAMRGVIIADLYYSSYSQCMKIGTRTMNVYVL